MESKKIFDILPYRTTRVPKPPPRRDNRPNQREKPDIGRRTRGFGREIPRFGNISGKISESITVARPPTPSCRAACPPAGHCPNLGNRRLPALGARAARRREARRSEAKRGEAGCRRRPDRRYRQIGREAFHGAPDHPRRCPEASRKRTAKRGGGAPAPDGHGHPCCACASCSRGSTSLAKGWETRSAAPEPSPNSRACPSGSAARFPTPPRP